MKSSGINNLKEDNNDDMTENLNNFRPRHYAALIIQYPLKCLQQDYRISSSVAVPHGL